MINLLGVRVSGPLESYAAGFAADLFRVGYTRWSASKQLNLMARFSEWLADEDLQPAELMPGTVKRFLGARRTAGYTAYYSPKGLVLLLRYLGASSALVVPTELKSTAVEAVLERYRTYLTAERGLANDTIRYYVNLVRPFLQGREKESGLDLLGLAPRDVTDFILGECRNRRGKAAKLVVTALRSLLKFLHLEGKLARPLAAAVPSVAGWRMSGLPRFLEPAQVGKLLASCDRREKIGRRDFAILLLLARLGMRAGEVVGLQLEDIDWRVGELVVCGKGDRQERLPLPSDVGDAIVGYLCHGRPPTAEGRALFVRHQAPHRPLNRGSVSNIVRGAGKRAGLGNLSAHRLRHTAATQLLRAGAPLEEIAQLLRHRSLTSTAIYAKVDRESLRTLARPWPGAAV